MFAVLAEVSQNLCSPCTDGILNARGKSKKNMNFEIRIFIDGLHIAQKFTYHLVACVEFLKAISTARKKLSLLLKSYK